MADKKKKVTSTDKKSTIKKSPSSASVASAKSVAPPTTVTPIDNASIDFEAGVLFNKFDKSKTGVLTADDFRQMWRDSKNSGTIAKPSPTSSGDYGTNGISFMGAGVDPAALSFEAGQIFSKFDKNGNGKLDKTEFEMLMKSYPELLKTTSRGIDNKKDSFPTEVISGRLLTHYDETAGIAIPRVAIEQHRSMGHTVTPLLESYRQRYDRLRAMLTGRLFPKREHLLQLRRQLQNCSIEVSAVRKGIERETMVDAEQIVERVRAVESMRQSSIKHQILQLEEDLEVIERIVRRVEQANENELNQSSTGVLLTSALPGDAPVETIRAPRAASMVELIQQFADINSTIEKVASKQLTVQVDFPTDDFPKETSERLEIIARCDRYMHALNVKDHMLWAAIQDKDKAEELLGQERKLSHDYAQEVAKWAEMSQGLGQQIRDLKKEKEAVEIRNLELIGILRDHNIFYVSKKSNE